ncbi:MAG: hypothetical protein WKF73_11250 [Nocardioidaceae bacterium]
MLRRDITDESVDLIYLDPPFNSNRNYSVLFKEKSGDEAQAQIEAFDDTWTWTPRRRDAIPGPAKRADDAEQGQGRPGGDAATAGRQRRARLPRDDDGRV